MTSIILLTSMPGMVTIDPDWLYEDGIAVFMDYDTAKHDLRAHAEAILGGK